MQERKRAELATERSEECYRKLFDGNPLPMRVYDTETLAFLAVNEASIRQYGFSREEFAAMTIKDIRGQDELPRLLENIAQQSGAFQSAQI